MNEIEEEIKVYINKNRKGNKKQFKDNRVKELLLTHKDSLSFRSKIYIDLRFLYTF